MARVTWPLGLHLVAVVITLGVYMALEGNRQKGKTMLAVRVACGAGIKERFRQS